MMTAKRLSSLMVIITISDLPAGDNVDILETGGNPDKQKNIKEPRLRAEPTIKRQAEPDTDSNRQHHRDAHTGDHGKAPENLTFILSHAKSMAKQM
jgi:hypothetical protein